MKLTIGASQIRKIIKSKRRAEAIRFIFEVFPNISSKRAEMLVDHIDETRINGSSLIMPASWDTLIGDIEKKGRGREAARERFMSRAPITDG